MLHGTRVAVLRKVQPISIHGQISLDVHYVDPDDDTEQVRVARIGPEAMARTLARLPSAPRHAYICGSTGFVEMASQLALDAGLPVSLIRTERYGGA